MIPFFVCEDPLAVVFLLINPPGLVEWRRYEGGKHGCGAKWNSRCQNGASPNCCNHIRSLRYEALSLRAITWGFDVIGLAVEWRDDFSLLVLRFGGFVSLGANEIPFLRMSGP